jgi:hypothetical protein
MAWFMSGNLLLDRRSNGENDVMGRMVIREKVSRREWQQRAKQMVVDNMQLQDYGKQATIALEQIHKIAAEIHESLRLLIMPKTKTALEDIMNIAGPYCIDVGEVEVKRKDGQICSSNQNLSPENGDSSKPKLELLPPVSTTNQ